MIRRRDVAGEPEGRAYFAAPRGSPERRAVLHRVLGAASMWSRFLQLDRSEARPPGSLDFSGRRFDRHF